MSQVMINYQDNEVQIHKFKTLLEVNRPKDFNRFQFQERSSSNSQSIPTKEREKTGWVCQFRKCFRIS